MRIPLLFFLLFFGIFVAANCRFPLGGLLTKLRILISKTVPKALPKALPPMKSAPKVMAQMKAKMAPLKGTLEAALPSGKTMMKVKHVAKKTAETAAGALLIGGAFEVGANAVDAVMAPGKGKVAPKAEIAKKPENPAQEEKLAKEAEEKEPKLAKEPATKEKLHQKQEKAPDADQLDLEEKLVACLSFLTGLLLACGAACCWTSVCFWWKGKGRVYNVEKKPEAKKKEEIPEDAESIV